MGIIAKNLKIIFYITLVVFVIDFFTNTLVIDNHDWDCKNYISIAKYGFKAFPLLSPFAYRFGTPFMASAINAMTGFSLYWCFKIIAYIGVIFQLFSLNLLISSVIKPNRCLYLVILITAFSIANVKAMLFDVYRADHLSYGIILIQCYVCWRRRYLILLILTIIGLQYREFTIVPLIAYIFCALKQDWMKFITFKYLVLTFFCLFFGIMVPRVLIPVTGSVQYIEFSLSGIKRAFTVLLNLKRDFNYIYSFLAYILPILMLASFIDLKKSFSSFSKDIRRFLGCYILFVMILTLFGGTDLIRFISYLFVPQCLILARIMTKKSFINVVLVLFMMSIFNRIWWFVPIWDYEKYLDFFGGYDSRLNLNSLCRALELIFFIAIGFLIRYFNVVYSREKI